MVAKEVILRYNNEGRRHTVLALRTIQLFSLSHDHLRRICVVSKPTRLCVATHNICILHYDGTVVFKIFCNGAFWFFACTVTHYSS
jgi:hypothetical protein